MNKPRKPWLAALLTFFTIGIGHVYCGRALRGIILFLVGVFIFGAFLSFSLLFPPVSPILGIVISLLFGIYCVIDSYKIAKESNSQYTLKNYNRWYVYLLCWLIGSVVIGNLVQMSIKANVVEAFKIPSGAMLNTLQIGDHIICNKLVYKISETKRGDIVIFPFPQDPAVQYVKRVIGLPGELIEIKNKKIFINGNLLNEPYAINITSTILSAGESPRDNMGPIEIPDNQLFLMGDNRDNSYDSRFWGFVNKSEIKGKVIYVYWSWNSKETSVRWSRIGKEF